MKTGSTWIDFLQLIDGFRENCEKEFNTPPVKKYTFHVKLNFHVLRICSLINSFDPGVFAHLFLVSSQVYLCTVNQMIPLDVPKKKEISVRHNFI